MPSTLISPESHAVMRILLACIGMAAAALACSLSQEPTATVPYVVLTTVVVTDTPPPPQPTAPAADEPCDFDLFPTEAGTSWDYVGTTSMESGYQRHDLITTSSADGFTVVTSLPDKTLQVEYGCTEEGLIQFDPAETWGAIGFAQGGAASMITLNQSGLSLPSDWFEGYSWPEYVEWQAVGQDTTIHGEYTFTHTAVGEETVTVPYATLEAMLVETDLEMVINGMAFPPCQISTWWAEDIGMVKQVFACELPPLSNTIELVGFSPP